eukprot:5454293-Heterocapsa_arctica.AAC.1
MLHLANALNIRTHQAVVILTVIFPIDSCWILAIKIFTKKYMEHTEGMDKEANIDAWNAFIKVMADNALTTNDVAATTTINDLSKMWAAAADFMKNDGGPLLQGTAPPGDFEGLVQTFLDKL